MRNSIFGDGDLEGGGVEQNMELIMAIGKIEPHQLGAQGKRRQQAMGMVGGRRLRIAGRQVSRDLREMVVAPLRRLLHTIEATGCTIRAGLLA